MAKSNFEKVESVVSWVRDKKITGYRISKETNAREMSIIALAQGYKKDCRLQSFFLIQDSVAKILLYVLL